MSEKATRTLWCIDASRGRYITEGAIYDLLSENNSSYFIECDNKELYWYSKDRFKVIHPEKSQITATEASSKEDVRSYNIGDSNYSKFKIQPWDVILEWGLSYFDGNILKYLLRNKSTDPRKQDYEKIIHYCKERIRQLDSGLE